MQTMRNENIRGPNVGRQQNRNNDMAIRDDDLTLFNDMRNKEQKNFLHPCLDDFDVSLSSKFGGLRNSGLSTPPWKGNDILATDGEKSDYDWLLTPPGTPLFPSLDKDSPLSHAEKMNITQTYSAEKSLRLSRSAVREMGNRNPRRSPGPSTPASAVSSTGSINSFMRGRAPSPSRKGSSPTPRPSTPTHRSSTPTHRLSTPTHRPSTPTHRPSTPTHRPSTPTARPATPPLRPSTPTKTLTRSTTILNKGTTRSSPPVLRRMNTSPSVRSSSAERNAPPSRGSSRGNSVSPKLRVWQSPEFGFGLEPPPNLRTSISDRPLSASRGSILTACRQSTHSEARHSYSDTLDTRWRNLSSSGSRISSSTTSQDRWSSKGSVISSSDDGTDVTEPMFLDCSLASPTSTLGEGRFENEASINGVPSTANIRDTTRPKRPASSLETHGLSNGSVRKALEPSMRHLDHHHSAASHMFRPLLSSAPMSSFYKLEHHGSHANPTSPVLERSITASSNASSGRGVRIFPSIDSSDEEETEIQSEWHDIPSPMPVDRKADAGNNSMMYSEYNKTFNDTCEKRTGIESIHSQTGQMHGCETELPRNGDTLDWPNSEAFEGTSNQRYDRNEPNSGNTDSTLHPNCEMNKSSKKNTDESEPVKGINLESCEMKTQSIPDWVESDVLDSTNNQNCEINISKNENTLDSPVGKSIPDWAECEAFDRTINQNHGINASTNGNTLDCPVTESIPDWSEIEVLGSTINPKGGMNTSSNGNPLDCPVSELQGVVSLYSCDTKTFNSQITFDCADSEALTDRISNCHEMLTQKEEEMPTTDVKYDIMVNYTMDVVSQSNVDTECDNEHVSSGRMKTGNMNEDRNEHISLLKLDQHFMQESGCAPLICCQDITIGQSEKELQCHETFRKFSCSVLDTRRKPMQVMYSGPQMREEPLPKQVSHCGHKILEKLTLERMGETIQQEVCSRSHRSRIQNIYNAGHVDISETEKFPAALEIEHTFPSKESYQVQVLSILENVTNVASLTDSDPQNINAAADVISSELTLDMRSDVVVNPGKQSQPKKSKKLQKGTRTPLVEKEDNGISKNRKSCDIDKEPNDSTSSKFSTGKHEKVRSSKQTALSAQNSCHSDMLKPTVITEDSKPNRLGTSRQQSSDENDDFTLPREQIQSCPSDRPHTHDNVSTILGEQLEDTKNDVEISFVSTLMEEKNDIDLTIATNHSNSLIEKERYNEGSADTQIEIIEPMDDIEHEGIQSEKEDSNEDFADDISHILEPGATELQEYVEIKEEQTNYNNVHLITESVASVDEVVSCETSIMDVDVHGGQQKAMDSTSISTIQKDSPQIISSASGRKPETHIFSFEEATNTILFCSSIVHDLVYKAASIAAEREESAALAQAAISTSQKTSKHSNLDYISSLREKTSKGRRKENRLSSNRSNKENKTDPHMAIVQQPAPVEAMKKTDTKDEVVQKPLSTVKERNQIRFATNTNCHCTVM